MTPGGLKKQRADSWRTRSEGVDDDWWTQKMKTWEERSQSYLRAYTCWSKPKTDHNWCKKEGGKEVDDEMACSDNPKERWEREQEGKNPSSQLKGLSK